jgi:type I restriction enzyme M protein
VPKSEIVDNKYDLSINRYKEIVYEEEEYEAPTAILGNMNEMEKEIAQGMKELQEMLG